VPTRRFDLLAAVACLLTLGMLVAYVSLVRSQGDSVAPWAVAVLLLAAVGTAWSTPRTARYGRQTLVACAVLLGLLGLLAILSIGLPILMAAGLCLVASLRRPARVAGPAATPRSAG
jgi:Na+/melibiose symporter-like transporter